MSALSLTERITATRAHGVLIDISALEIVDSFIGRMLANIAAMYAVFHGPAGIRAIAVQALHSFYVPKTGEVVASWMTKLNRDEAIADNLEYVRRVVAAEDVGGTDELLMRVVTHRHAIKRSMSMILHLRPLYHAR